MEENLNQQPQPDDTQRLQTPLQEQELQADEVAMASEGLDRPEEVHTERMLTEARDLMTPEEGQLLPEEAVDQPDGAEIPEDAAFAKLVLHYDYNLGTACFDDAFVYLSDYVAYKMTEDEVVVGFAVEDVRFTLSSCLLRMD